MSVMIEFYSGQKEDMVVCIMIKKFKNFCFYCFFMGVRWNGGTGQAAPVKLFGK